MAAPYTEYLKCDFTDAQIAEFARDLARANRTLANLEDEKKQVVSQFKADMDKAQAEINRLSQFITTGSEYRNVECRVDLDTPEPGKKRIIRLDTQEEVKTAPMTDMDRQMRLELQQAAEKEEAAKPKEPIVTPPPQLRVLPAPQAEPEVIQESDESYEASEALLNQRKPHCVDCENDVPVNPGYPITHASGQVCMDPDRHRGPALAPAAVMGGTHQKGTKGRRREPRNPEREGIADGSAPDPADEG